MSKFNAFGGGAKCPVCTKTVYKAEEVVSNGQNYHKQCFRCSNCKSSLVQGKEMYCKNQVCCQKCYKILSTSPSVVAIGANSPASFAVTTAGTPTATVVATGNFTPSTVSFSTPPSTVSLSPPPFSKAFPAAVSVPAAAGGTAPSLTSVSSAGKFVAFGGGAKCPVCAKTVYKAEEVSSNGQSYHKQCFRCSNCKNSLVQGKEMYCKNQVCCQSCYQILVRPPTYVTLASAPTWTPSTAPTWAPSVLSASAGSISISTVASKQQNPGSEQDPDTDIIKISVRYRTQTRMMWAPRKEYWGAVRARILTAQGSSLDVRIEEGVSFFCGTCDLDMLHNPTIAEMSFLTRMDHPLIEVFDRREDARSRSYYDEQADRDTVQPDDVPTIQSVLEAAAAVPEAVAAALPVSNFVFTFQQEEETIEDASPEKFRAEFCAVTGTAPASIIRIEVVRGSKVYQVLTGYTVELAAFDVYVKAGESVEPVPDGTTNKKQILDHLEKQKPKFGFLKSAWSKIKSVVVKAIDMVKAQVDKFQSFFSPPPPQEIVTPYDADSDAAMGKLMAFLSLATGTSRLPLKVSRVCVYHNEKLEPAFQRTLRSNSDVRFLFHGSYSAAQTDIHGLVYQGLETKMVGGTDSGYFGRGFYFTSFLDYALFYQFGLHADYGDVKSLAGAIREKGGKFKMMMFVVNLGRVEEFNRPPTDVRFKQFHRLIPPEAADVSKPVCTSDRWTTVRGKDLPASIDARHVIVSKGAPWELAGPSIALDHVYDEFVVRQKDYTNPQYVVEMELAKKILIWRNTNFEEEAYKAEFRIVDVKYGSKLQMVGADSTEEALELIEAFVDKAAVYVMTNRAKGGREFIEACRVRGVTNPALVFCMVTTGWEEMKNVSIANSFEGVFKFIDDNVV